jgi:GNAT superfamily N-acetyltransferase
MTTIQIFEQVGNFDGVFAHILSSIDAGIADGAFPAVRATPACRPTGGETALVIFDGPKPCAFALFYQPEGFELFWVDFVWVDPEYRRRGLATELLKGVLTLAKQRGLPVELGTLVNNEAMRALAAKLGLAEKTITFEAA